MKRVRYEVLPTPKAARGQLGLLRWSITKGRQRVATKDTKAQAVKFATGAARLAWRTDQEPAEVVIKGLDGKIMDTRTYGLDPRGTKG